MENAEPENKSIIFLAIPTYDGQICASTANVLDYASKKHGVIKAINQTSLLANGFNKLLCLALNSRKEHNIKWFAMLHADIIPEKFWLDKLIDLAEEHDADLLSAVVPIKDASGDTSTAFGLENDPWGSVYRLNYVYLKSLPEPFSIDDVEDAIGNILLVNTGCMILNIEKDWNPGLYFTIRDQIVSDGEKFIPQVIPEDWNLSRMVAAHGGKVMATTAIELKHVGIKYY